MIDNIGIFLNSECTIPVDEINGNFSISKSNLFETSPDYPNLTQLYIKNFESFAIYQPHISIIKDDFDKAYGTGRKAQIYLDGGLPSYDLLLTSQHQPNQVIKITLMIDIPRTLSDKNNLIVGLAYYSLDYLPSIPVYKIY